MEDPVLDLQSPENPTAEIIIGAQELQGPQPSFGVDVCEPSPGADLGPGDSRG